MLSRDEYFWPIWDTVFFVPLQTKFAGGGGCVCVCVCGGGGGGGGVYCFHAAHPSVCPFICNTGFS